VKERVIVHESGTRNEKLIEFKDSKDSSILFAIKMEEGWTSGTSRPGGRS
jgi:hypothetical protein